MGVKVRSVECGVRNNIGLIGLISLIGLINPSNAQVVVGPLTSTPNAIPFFVDSTGRKITNSTIIFTNNALVINGITQAQNPFTTNNPAKAPNLLATSTSPIYPLMILIPDGSGSDRTIAYSPNFFMSNGVAFFLGNVHLSGLSSNTLLRVDAGGNINNIIGNTANTITYWTGSGTVAGLANGAEGTALGISNGVPAYIAAGGDTTNPVQNFYSTSNYFTVGKGGKLIVTNGITPLDVTANSLLSVDSNQKIAAATLTGDVSNSGQAVTIVNNAVTYAKLQQVSATQKVLGRNTAGAGNAEEVGASAMLDWIGATRGSILERGASGWTVITPGTSGYLLQSAGAGADPIWAVAPSGGLATSASQYVIVGGAASATANWTALSNAYETAKSATPNGAALSTGNRYTILLLPGVYDMGSSTLTMNTDFIDLVGISSHTGQMEPLHAGGSSAYSFGDTILQSSGAVITSPNGSINQDDKMIENLMLYSTGGLTFTTGSAGTGDRFQMKNVFIHRSAIASSAMSDVTYKGFFYQVRCFNAYAYGYDVAGSAQSQWILCVGGQYAWGGYGAPGSAPGVYYYCQGGASTFGDTASGTFYYCKATSGFGESGFSGTAYHCESGGTGFGNSGTMSGTMVNCYVPTFAGSVTGTVIGSTLGAVEYTQTGSATVLVKEGGTLKVNTTSTGNVGGGEDTLITYTVPAAVLSVNGQYLEFDCWGSFAANANTKDLKIYYGATTLFDTTALVLNGVDWRGHGKIVRTSATAQTATCEFTIGGTLLGALTTTTTTTSAPAETLSGTVVFKVTGTDSGGVPVDNSVVQKGMVMKWYPAGN